MPQKKISELTEITKLSSDSLILIEDNNQINYSINFKNLFDNIYENIQELLLEKMYPIGTIYTSINNSNPGTLFNFGEWEQIKDVFLLSAGDIYTAGNTGGEASHTLTINEMPNHQHQTPFPGNDVADGTYTANHFNFLYGKGQTASEMKQNVEMYNEASANQAEGNEYAYMTNFIGNSQPHNNMPPYLVVYRFKRIK